MIFKLSINPRVIAISVLLALGLSLSHASVRAEEVLTPHTAEYKVKISVLSGTLNTQLDSIDDGYRATHSINPTGLARVVTGGRIHEMSAFTAIETGVLPFAYTSEDTISKEKTHARIGFDWDTGSITGVVNGEEISDSIDGLAHDRVSIQYELMHDLMNGGASETYVLFDIDEFKTLNVSNIGTKTVKVPAGEFEAVGIQHQAEGSSRITTLWCVAELDYLPVIIEQHRKGKLRLRATLREYNAN